jgi:hypothetical protein
MSKRYPNNGPTFVKGKRKVPKSTDGERDPRLDVSRPEVWVSKKSRDLITEWIKDPAKMHKICRKWTIGGLH